VGQVGRFFGKSEDLARGLLMDEFPDFDVSTLPPIPESWIPTHWHNDCCPSWLAAGNINQPLGYYMRVFVDYPDLNDREIPSASRYTYAVGGQHKSCDSWEQVIVAAVRFASFFGPPSLDEIKLSPVWILMDDSITNRE